ncbi:MAG: hypothetical protein NVS9B3_08660 [Gemmatimonadaceae bacterium]
MEIDGHPFATLGLDGVERLKLATGRDVGVILGQIEAEGATTAVVDRAMAMLARRPRARTELGQLLVRKGAERAVVERALTRLAAQGLVDDGRFARQYARSKLVGAGHSRKRVDQELARKGVPRDVAARAIADVVSDEAVDEREIVRAAAVKKAHTLARCDPATRRRRLYAYLARRGYDGDAIRSVMSSVLGRDATGDDASALSENG